MKKSEKIGILIVIVLSMILVGSLLSGGTSKTKKENACQNLCQPYSSGTWFFIGESIDGSNNNFSTKNECIDACLK